MPNPNLSEQLRNRAAENVTVEDGAVDIPNYLSLSAVPMQNQVIMDVPVDKFRDFFTADIGFRTQTTEEFMGLAHSIEENGLIEEVIARPIPNSDLYETIAGMHRVKAHKFLEKETVRAKVINVSDARAILIATETNLKRRQSISPIEMGYAFVPWIIVLARGIEMNEIAIITVFPGQTIRYTKTFHIRPVHIVGNTQVMLSDGTWLLGIPATDQAVILESPYYSYFPCLHTYILVRNGMFPIATNFGNRDFFGNNRVPTAPNLFYGGATNVTMGRWIEGAIDTPGDVDWVRLNGGVPERLTIQNLGGGQLTVSGYNLTGNRVFPFTMISANSQQNFELSHDVRYLRFSGATGGECMA